MRRKSSELSSTMKSRLEAFERAKAEAEAEAEEERKRSTSVQPPTSDHDEKFREKLKNFQKISSQTDLNARNAFNKAENKKPPPPLSYSKLIEVRKNIFKFCLKYRSESKDCI